MCMANEEPFLSMVHTLSKQSCDRDFSLSPFRSSLETMLRLEREEIFPFIVSDSFSCHNKGKSDLCNANPATELVHSFDAVFSI